jgi:hypothetical protein
VLQYAATFNTAPRGNLTTVNIVEPLSLSSSQEAKLPALLARASQRDRQVQTAHAHPRGLPDRTDSTPL